ncbi:MAG: hypothetical protein MN733_09050, partial [Nitrososphaera sp.]|nr:hypothetical protein [Nitrososphaera sp.]
MGELDDKVFDFCQKVLKGAQDGEALEEIERESVELIELINKDSGKKAAPGLFSLIPREVIQKRINSIKKFSGYEIGGSEFIGGGAIGAYCLSLRSKNKTANLILKIADGKGDELGARLAVASGLS